MSFVKFVLESGGAIKPLLIPPQDLSGPSLTNPSVLVVDEKILVNIRNVNYTLYHSELNKFEHMWGPLTYVHPENDLHLRSVNYIAELDDNLDMIGWNFYMMPELAARGLLLMNQFYNLDGSKKHNQDLTLPYPDLSQFKVYQQ
jgi:hypothetical protein